MKDAASPSPGRIDLAPRLSCVVLAVAALLAATPARASGDELVVCAPGFPGTTENAQAVMDDFAALVSRRASLATPLAARYYPAERDGVARIESGDPGLALVPLPFFLKHERDLGLRPRLTAEQGEGGAQRWSLVVPKGRVGSPADVDGWELVSVAGYAPGFVRGPALGAWGALPAGTRIVFDDRLLPALRRAAAGDDVAVLLDRDQARALDRLPFREGLEIAATSPPLPDALFCSVRDRPEAARAEAVARALDALDEDESGESAAMLDALRMKRFAPVDREALDRAREAYAAATR